MSFRLLGKMFGRAMSNGRGEGFTSSRMKGKEVDEEYWSILFSLEMVRIKVLFGIRLIP